MKARKKLLIINLSLFIAADLAVTGFVLTRANKNNELPVFTPTTTEATTSENNKKEDTIVVGETEYKVEVIPTETPTSTEEVAEETIEVTEPVITEPEIEIIPLNKSNITPEVVSTRVQEGTITTDTTMYTAPSDKSLSIKNLNISDTAYRILSDSNGWDLIRTENNEIGFIESSNIEYSGSSLEKPFELNIKNDIVVTTTNVNLRKGPSTDDEIIRTLDNETELQVLGETDEWYLVHLNGELGFVNKNYTFSLLEKINNQYPEFGLDNLTIDKVVEVRETVNYRTGPNTDSDIIRQFSKSETMRVIGELDGWYFGITDDYQLGFVSKEYTEDLTGIFIDTDILSQRLRMYNDNHLMIYTRVKTGADATPTDEGHFKIFWMGEDENIVDDIVVNYWMNYNNGEGIHDLVSCTSYGEDDYHYAGSHGCTRTPLENVAKIYQKAQIGTPVIVHK